MENQHYSTTIEMAASPQEVFAAINDVAKWWAKPSFKGTFEGKSSQLHDEFIVRFGDAHYSKQLITEFVPNFRIVWQVTDSTLSWLKDKSEWTGTKMIFELTPKDNHTVLKFTHEGINPQQECYEKCSQGWNMLVKESLRNLLMEHAEK